MILRQPFFFLPCSNHLHLRSWIFQGIQTSTYQPASPSFPQPNDSSGPNTNGNDYPSIFAPRPSSRTRDSSSPGKVDQTPLKSQVGSVNTESEPKKGSGLNQIPSPTQRSPNDFTKNQHLLESLSKIGRISARTLDESKSWNAQIQHIRNVKVTERGGQRTDADNVALKSATLDAKKLCEQNIETLLAVRRTLVARLEILNPKTRFIRPSSFENSIGSKLETLTAGAEKSFSNQKESWLEKVENIVENKFLRQYQEDEEQRVGREMNSVSDALENKTEEMKRNQEKATREAEREKFRNTLQADDRDWSSGKPGRLYEVHGRIKQLMNSEFPKVQDSPPETTSKWSTISGEVQEEIATNGEPSGNPVTGREEQTLSPRPSKTAPSKSNQAERIIRESENGSETGTEKKPSFKTYPYKDDPWLEPIPSPKKKSSP